MAKYHYGSEVNLLAQQNRSLYLKCGNNQNEYKNEAMDSFRNKTLSTKPNKICGNRYALTCQTQLHVGKLYANSQWSELLLIMLHQYPA